ncbi:MAG: hypothetical protein COY86_01400, partial [Rhodobacterales bacterium CG_4_10_14_0_8_um_filter_70_9]
MSDDAATLDAAAAAAIARGAASEMFSTLGAHPIGKRWALRAWVPGAETVTAVARDGAAEIARLA